MKIQLDKDQVLNLVSHAQKSGGDVVPLLDEWMTGCENRVKELQDQRQKLLEAMWDARDTAEQNMDLDESREQMAGIRNVLQQAIDEITP